MNINTRLYIEGKCKFCGKDINSDKQAVYVYMDIFICEPCYTLFYRVKTPLKETE